MNSPFVYFPSKQPKVRAVTLMVHGLNVKPLAMGFLAKWLCENGSDVYLVKLSGHYNESKPIHKVTRNDWENDMFAGYQQANDKASQLHLPLLFLGYSLGALLGQTMLSLSLKDCHFQKQVLVSPAIAIRPWSYVIKTFFLFGQQFRLPSFTPKEYSFNRWLPLTIYKILFEEEQKYLQSNSVLLNQPTLVIMDPKDEMISYKKLIQTIKRLNLTNYKVLLLDHHLAGRSKKHHHLIVDESTMGRKNWKVVSKELEEFLFNE